MITSAWGNMVRDQLVTPFADAATRTTQITAPVEGMLSYLADTNVFEGYDGASWVQPASLRVGSSGWASQTSATTVETLVTDSPVTFTVVAGRRYLAKVSSMCSSNVAADNITINLRSAAGAAVTNVGTVRRTLTIGTPAANTIMAFSFEQEMTGIAAGQTTFGLFVLRYSGSGTATTGNALGSGNSLGIYDIGV